MSQSVPRKRRSKKADEALAQLISQGRSLRDAAREAKMCEKTAQRRAKLPEFQHRVAELVRERFAQCGRLSTAFVGPAIAKLAELLDSDNEQVSLGSARSLVEVGTRFHEVLDLEVRIAELEARAVAAEQQPVPFPRRAVS